MADELVDQKFALAIMNHLVNIYHPSASLIMIYVKRLDMRIEHGPLPRPIIAHALVSMDEAALHSVRPDHIGVHPGQHRVEAAGIEIAVGSLVVPRYVRPVRSTCQSQIRCYSRYSGWSGAIRQMSGRLR